MNDLTTHLTAAQLDGILIGDTNSAALAHIESCPTCAAELDTTRSSITLFGEALTSMAQNERSRLAPRPTLIDSFSAKRPIRRLTATLALAASVAIVATVVPFGHLMPPPAVKTPPPVPVSSVQSDEALLNEIDQQLSASVPAALAPLEDPTDPTGGQTSTTPSNANNKKD